MPTTSCLNCTMSLAASRHTCWSCNQRDDSTVNAMNNWLNFAVAEIRAGRHNTNHYYLTGSECACSVFDASREAHRIFDEAWNQMGRSATARQHLGRPPMDIVRIAAGIAVPQDSDYMLTASTTVNGRASRVRNAIAADVRSMGRTNRTTNSCGDSDCVICNLVKEIRNGVSAPTVVAGRTDRVITPVVTSRVGWGVELETYLPAKFIRNEEYDYDDDDDDEDDDEFDGDSGYHGYNEYPGNTCDINNIFIPRGSYHHGRPIRAYGAPDGWRAEGDGSLSTNKRGYAGIEIISPVLSGRAGIESVEQMSRFLQQFKPHQNHMSGMHCHVSVGDATADELYHLRYLFAQMELAFYASCGNLASRRMLSDYCHPSTQWLKRPPTAERYSTLNMQNTAFSVNRRSDSGHAEIRIWPGTTRAETVSMAVHMSVAMIGAMHEDWLPPDDADLNDIPTVVRLMCELMEKYPAADTAHLNNATAALERRSHNCDLSAPAIRTYAVDKEAVLP